MKTLHNTPLSLTAFVVVALCHFIATCHAYSTFEVFVNMENSTYSTDLKFVSFAVGSRTLVRTTGRNPQFKVDSPKMLNLAKAMSPCSVRMGGSYANFMIFDPEDGRELVPKDVMDQWESTFKSDFWGDGVGSKDWSNRKFDGEDFTRWINFTKEAEWDLIFDVNQLLQDPSGIWDPTNFKMLLKFMERKDIEIFGFQLGNEPNSYSFKFKFPKTTASMVRDYKRFHRLLQQFPTFKDSMIVGPEPTSLARNKRAPEFLDEFLRVGGHNYLDAIGLHHYYFEGASANMTQFLNPEIMDMFKILAQSATDIRDRRAPNTKIYMTETANAFGGGSPDYSHSFVSTFIYLDEMGLAAKYGLDRVHRQTFNSGNYAVINSDSLQPYPDYYLALLFKRLVEGPVLDVEFTPHQPHLRIYAHCARRDVYRYPRGSVVVYFSNLGSKPITLDLSAQYSNSKAMSSFILTSGDRQDLGSENVRLNDEVLTMSGNDLPKLDPKRVKGPVTVPGYSTGFLVMMRIRNSPCWNYTREQ